MTCSFSWNGRIKRVGEGQNEDPQSVIPDSVLPPDNTTGPDQAS
jgi:hypothetical protein